MKNTAALLLSVTLVIAAGFGISSCKDDDPPTRPKLSFAETEITVNEDDGNLEVELVLDKAHSKDLRIEYELGGTASDQDVVGTANADYRVIGDHGVVKIPAGSTSGVIELAIIADAAFEPDETIIIAIIDTNTDEIELTANDEVTITLKNDDAQLIASFQQATMTVNEGDGIQVSGGELVAVPVSIPVQLDKAPTADIVVKYTIKIDLSDPARNDAIDSTWGFNNQVPSRFYDYYVKGTTGELTIPSGATSANIELQLLTDFMFDPDETIEITLEPSGAIQVGAIASTEITVEEQDGKVIALVWPRNMTHKDVDLDMFLWSGADTTNLDLILAASINADTVFRAEVLFIPALFSDGAFGLSYVYYEGTADPMNFIVRFVDFTDGVTEAEGQWDIFEGGYNLANINKWNLESGVYPPRIAQRFVVTDGVYSYGAIQRSSTASRLRPGTMPKPLRSQKFKPRPGQLPFLR